ncbi:hypothetical protein ACFWRV_06895 [Streptomyces sp. NPDC058576]|uniref:hypothetical protein n=1 Tax=Streptomyces sp. NPDC058576 TaxID=3346547 RepID=UPI0036518415
MKNSFLASWIILSRPLTLLSASGAAALFAVALTAGTFITAARPGGSRLSDPPLLVADMGAANVPGNLVGRLAMVLGAVALSVCAASIATEFTSGTVRHQLIRLPSRARWLAGRALALAVLVVAVSALATATVLASAYVAAAAWGVPTDGWATAAGLRATLRAAGGVQASTLGFAAIGAGLALLLRSSIAAIGFGLVYGLFESLLAAIVPGAAKILPGQVLAAVATGGSDELSFSQAVLRATAFVVAVYLTAAVVFLRRDITE